MGEFMDHIDIYPTAKVHLGSQVSALWKAFLWDSINPGPHGNYYLAQYATQKKAVVFQIIWTLKTGKATLW